MKNGKNNFQSLIKIGLVIILISSVIQILPIDIIRIKRASASSTWIDTNWSAPTNYTDSWQVETTAGTGDLGLHYGPGIFVADTIHRQIVQTNMNGTIWTALGSQGSGKGQFNGTEGVSYDESTGFIYVMDYSNCRIVKTKIDGTGWTTYGSQGSGAGQFYNPGGIHYDSSSGYIYVADTGNDRIVKTMMNGSGWTTYGSWGYGTGLFKEPWGLCYDNSTGYIYVADYFNYRIVKTKIDGTGRTTYGSAGTGSGQFKNPHSVCYDKSTGDMYVADRYNHRIIKTMMNGSGWTAYGSQGGGIGQFEYPEDIKYDGDTGYVYVVDSGNHRIVKTMMNGSGWTTYGSFSEAPGIGKFYYPSYMTLFDSCYCSKGFLDSRIYDCSGPSNLKNISWVGETPSSTSIKFQLRTANNESNLATKDFIGPDGTNNTYYTTSSATIWSGHNGDGWVQYRVNLSSSDFSKTPVLKDVTIIYNILPTPPTLIAPENNSCTNNNIPTFTWIFNDTDSNPQSAFQWQVDDLIDFGSVDYDSNPIITPISSFTPESSIPEGIWYWRVRVRDSDNDWGPYSLPWRILIDTTAPSSEIIYPSNNKFHNDIDSISGFSWDCANGSGVDKVELSIHRITGDSYWDGTSWVDSEFWLPTSGTSGWNYNSSSVPWSSGCEYQITSRATDNASNIEHPGVGNTFIYDAEQVIYSNAYPLADEISNITEVEAGITISDMISGVNASTIEYSLSNNSGVSWELWKPVDGYISGKIVDVNLKLTIPNGTGNKIRWCASDIAGNGPTYSDEYLINVNIPKPPVIPEIKLHSPANNSKITTTSIEFSWEVVKNYHPYILFDIKLDTINPPQNIIEQNYTGTKLNIDELENGKTYYWTVIPRLGSLNGICISGIWSFNFNIPLPQAILKMPENNSVISSTLPTLAWSLEYNGTDTVTYDIYFGTSNNPPLKHEKLTTTYFAIDTALQDNTTYYWQVVPWVGKYQGLSSPVWSFTVKSKDGEIPRFGLDLKLTQDQIEIKSGEVKFISAIVTNIGELKDNFTVSIGIINNTNLNVEVYRQDTLEIDFEKNKEFLIMISVKDGTELGFENVTIIAKSNLAEEYNLDIQDSKELTIEILEKDKQKDGD